MPHASFSNFRLGLPIKHFIDNISSDTKYLPEHTIQQIKHDVLAASDKMRELGATVIKGTDMNLDDEEAMDLSSSLLESLAFGIKEDLPSYLLTVTNSKVKNLEDLVNYNDHHAVCLLF